MKHADVYVPDDTRFDDTHCGDDALDGARRQIEQLIAMGAPKVQIAFFLHQTRGCFTQQELDDYLLRAGMPKRR